MGLAAALAITGCAHERETMTFAEAGIFDPDDTLEPPEPPAEPEPAAPARPPEPSALARAPSAPLLPLPPLPPVPALPATAATALQWPLAGAFVSSHFGMRHHPIDGDRRMHWGIDLSAHRGRMVGAAAPGLVVRAGWARGYGLLVEIRHVGGLTTRYSHLSRLLCAPGEAVEAGQALGLVGTTGRATGPHLHFEVWHAGRARDPLALLGRSYGPWSAVAWRGTGASGREGANP